MSLKVGKQRLAGSARSMIGSALQIVDQVEGCFNDPEHQLLLNRSGLVKLKDWTLCWMTKANIPPGSQESPVLISPKPGACQPRLFVLIYLAAYYVLCRHCWEACILGKIRTGNSWLPCTVGLPWSHLGSHFLGRVISTLNIAGIGQWGFHRTSIFFAIVSTCVHKSALIRTYMPLEKQLFPLSIPH